MAGIYIHIPFCRKACHYCNFHFSVSPQLIPQMVAAIAQEATLRNGYTTENISTIYFGGGTPSLLRIEDCTYLIEHLKALFVVDKDAEITLEANPDDISREKLSAWKNAGINRLSIGVQSFFNDDLRWMNRAHNATQAYNSIQLAVEHGFNNITMDLIYGTPLISDAQWLQNLEKAKQLTIQHLSCYALTVEPHTALQKMITLQKKENVDAEKQSRQFEILMQWSELNGYEHYEISNFAKAGFRSRHNSSYWQGKPYIGLGPSAHSYDGISRQWNIASNNLYIQSINKNIVPCEKEWLTSTQKINEYVMTSLRTLEGINLRKLEKLCDPQMVNAILYDAQKFTQQNLLQRKNGALILTDKGKLFADGIAADLFR